MNKFVEKILRFVWIMVAVLVIPAVAVWLIGGLLVVLSIGLISYLFDPELRANLKKPLSKGVLNKQ